MKKFTFRFEALYALRRQRLDDAQLLLAKAYDLCRVLEEEKKDLHEKLHTAQHAAASLLHVRELYLTRIRSNIKSCEKKLERAIQEKDQKIIEYTETEKLFKTMEILKEKEYEDYKHACKNEEYTEIQDILSAQIPQKNFGT